MVRLSSTKHLATGSTKNGSYQQKVEKDQLNDIPQNKGGEEGEERGGRHFIRCVCTDSIWQHPQHTHKQNQVHLRWEKRNRHLPLYTEG